MDFKKIYIGGEWIYPNSREYLEVENPADKTIVARVPRSDEVDVERAIESARGAFEAWSTTSLEERIRIMENFIVELEKRIDIMAETVVKELGAPYDFARDTHIKSYIEDGKNFIKIARDYEFEKSYSGYTVVREPYGVVGAITPWNYPFGQITKKIFPALLAGNTLVLKPSQNTPLVAYYLTEALDEAGLPKGVFNLVTGRGSEVGNVIARHKDIDLVSFTGSTVGGIEVAKLGLDSVKAMALELGGKSPAIILEGADLDVAFKVLFGSIFRNTGQSCSALSRLLVPSSMKSLIEEKLLEKVKDLSYGDPTTDVFLGPLASLKQWIKVNNYLKLANDEGARLLYGEIPKDHKKGYYMGPIIFTDVENSMKIAQEEIFGPVLSIISYDSIEQAIEIANDTRYGLSGAVFGPEDQARKLARRMKTGTVIVNNQKRTLGAPFGGYKESGIGREGGIYGFDEYLEIKTIFE